MLGQVPAGPVARIGFCQLDAGSVLNCIPIAQALPAQAWTRYWAMCAFPSAELMIGNTWLLAIVLW